MKFKKVSDFQEKNRQENALADLEEMQAQTLMTAMLTDTLIIPDEGGDELDNDGFGFNEED